MNKIINEKKKKGEIKSKKKNYSTIGMPFTAFLLSFKLSDA